MKVLRLLLLLIALLLPFRFVMAGGASGMVATSAVSAAAQMAHCQSAMPQTCGDISAKHGHGGLQHDASHGLCDQQCAAPMLLSSWRSVYVPLRHDWPAILISLPADAARAPPFRPPLTV